MGSKQKALIVSSHLGGRPHGLDELNLALGRGWRVVHVSPMGGAGVGTGPDPTVCLAALVVLERGDEAQAELPMLAEEEADEVLDELLEGGAPGTVEVPDDFDGGAPLN